MNTEYLVLDGKQLKQIIKQTVKFLSKSKWRYGAIAFRGMSGALIAPAVAAQLGKEVILLRKKEVDRHSTLDIEGSDCKTYIIIDDGIESGKTINTITEQLNDRTLKGIVLYRGNHFMNDSDIEKMKPKFNEWFDNKQVKLASSNGRKISEFQFS